MKVTRIEIKDFNQFKDIDIDLTYPKGHAKEGQPLEKVCFIGQSGTGKTTLLKVIGNSCFDIYTNDFFKSKYDWILVEKFYKGYKQQITSESNAKGTISLKAEYFSKRDRQFFQEHGEYRNKLGKLINYPANLKFEYKKEKSNVNILEKNVIDFERDNISEIWDLILDNVVKYRETIIALKNQISDFATSGNTGFYKNKLNEAILNYNSWIKTNPNPLDEIADNCIDFLLSYFKLKVKRDFEFTKKEDLDFIKIEDFNGNEVPFDLWSTGTRQLLYSTLPLYQLKPENTIILFDEPERSLYPDMQRMIIDFYSSLTKDSQFFYATHSPIIASSFEPWEIIELKLNENGHVYQDIYYKGDRHVDNYHIVPQYLSYDKMLRNVFDLNETRNQIGIDKIGDALMYKNHLLKLKKEGKTNTKEFKELYLKYTKLAEQLAWDFNVLDDEKS